MRIFIILTALLFLQACKHPLAIEGEGDIIERLIGHRGCSLEEFEAGAPRCAENEVMDEDYAVSYEAVPRPGWRFLRWEGTGCAADSVQPYCDYNLGAELVDAMDKAQLDTVFPPTVAVFVENTPKTFIVRAKANGGFGPELGGVLTSPSLKEMVVAAELAAGQTATVTAVGEINIATNASEGIFVTPDGEDFPADSRPTPFHYFPLEEAAVDAGELRVPISNVALNNIGGLIGAFVAQKIANAADIKALNDDPDPDVVHFSTPEPVAGGVSAKNLFLVGTGPFEFTAPENGTLFLGINDAGVVNNAGKFEVTVTIE